MVSSHRMNERRNAAFLIELNKDAAQVGNSYRIVLEALSDIAARVSSEMLTNDDINYINLLKARVFLVGEPIPVITMFEKKYIAGVAPRHTTHNQIAACVECCHVLSLILTIRSEHTRPA